METRFLTASGVARALDDLMDEHEEFHWAVAWGTSPSLVDKLLARASKIRAVTFGLAFAQTDPGLVNRLIGIHGCRVVTAFRGGTFHPKVYAFRSGDRVAAIVGSANFTAGGLGRNHEASVLLSGSADDAALADILAFTRQSAQLGTPVSADIAQQYALACKRAARTPKLPRDPLIGLDRTSLAGLSSPLVDMTWPQYVRAVRRSNYHDIGRSLDLLRTAQALFSAAPSFHALSSPQRKAIAGFLGEAERALHAGLDLDWGWFGSMRGAGDFMNRVAENDRFLASAINSIPQRGDVGKQHYERFAKLFVKAFRNSERVGSVATASRLLAMKRPDVFLCVCNPNRAEASSRMGFPVTQLRLDNYWDRVVEVIRASDWYNTDKPTGRDGQLWECRAAMLDAIFYRPAEVVP